MTAGPAALPERPPVSSPDRPRESSRVVTSQPRLGLIGLVLVVPIAAVLAVGAGGPERSALVLGPLVTYALPLVAVVAFWWEDWPGTSLRPSWSGWADTALIAGGAVVLTAAGQTVVSGLDLRGIFDPFPGPGHTPTFPATLPLAATAFVAMLELTLVGEGWPLRRLPRLPAGLVALALSWAVALIVYFALANVRGDLGTVLIVIGALQALIYVALRGWPFSSIAGRGRRLTCAHAGVIAGGIATYLAVHDVLGVGREPLAAYAGCVVATALLLGMQFEGWLDRTTTVIAALVSAAALAVALRAVAGGVEFRRVSVDDWVTHVGLNALGVSIILHVAIGRRWPFRLIA